MMEKEYVYTIVREDPVTGECAKRTRKYRTFVPRLAVGNLYADLRQGYLGYWRVLRVREHLVPAWDWIH